MNIRMIGSGLALTVATLVSNASAVTTIHGALCHPQNPNSRSIVTNHFLGCSVSPSSGTVAVVLPATRINQGQAQQLYVDYVNTGTTSETVSCNAYLYPYNGGPAIWSGSRSGTCSSAGTFDYSVPADSWGYLSVMCNLPRSCRLLGAALDPG